MNKIENLIIHSPQFNHAKWRVESVVTGKPPNFYYWQNLRWSSIRCVRKLVMWLSCFRKCDVNFDCAVNSFLLFLIGEESNSWM